MEPAARAAAAGPPLRVLCVDDYPDTADSESALLRLTGCEARACYDGPSALREAAGFRPGVCLVDLNMPGMDGDEVAAGLRLLLGDRVLLVAVTAMSDARAGRRIRAAGFDLHLVKPVDPHELLAVVDAQWKHRAEGAEASEPVSPSSPAA